jgi:hypothetical protein
MYNMNGRSVKEFDLAMAVDYWYLRFKSTRHRHGNKKPKETYVSKFTTHLLFHFRLLLFYNRCLQPVGLMQPIDWFSVGYHDD